MKTSRIYALLCGLCLTGQGCTEEDPPPADAGAEEASSKGSGQRARPGADDADAGDKDKDVTPKQQPKAAPAKQPAMTPAAAGAAAPPSNAAGAAASMPAAGSSSSAPQQPQQPAMMQQPVLMQQPAAPQPGEIEIVAMDLVYTSDNAGNLLQDPRPIILFKDGWATRDMNYVVRGLDVAAHKMMFPKTWVEWKLVDDKVALKNNNGEYKKLYFQNRYPPNKSSLTFEQKFTRFVGGTNTALGTSAISQRELQFWNDHTVVSGSYAAVITPGTVSQSVPPDRRGKYQIDGYTIELKWDDGTTKKTSFVWSADDPEAIYVDGLCYIVLD